MTVGLGGTLGLTSYVPVTVTRADLTYVNTQGQQGLAEVKTSMNHMPDLSDLTINQEVAMPLILAGATTNVLWGNTNLPIGSLISFQQWMFVGIEFIPVNKPMERPNAHPMGG